MNEFNQCNNWLMRVYEQKVTDKCVTLRCTVNSKKKDGNGYTKPSYIDVICISGKCEIEEEDYTKRLIKVNGTFYPDEYTTSTGEKRPALKIFADSVEANPQR